MFQVSQVAMEMVKAVRPLERKIHARDAGLADQMRRAVQSVALNFGEARWRRGRDKSNRFTFAAGSAEEAREALRIALAWGYVGEREAGPVLELLDRILAMSWRLIYPRR